MRTWDIGTRAHVLARLLAVTIVVSGCGASGAEIDPGARSAFLSTTACGDASSTNGSAVVVGGGRALTAAHLVIGASTVTVELPRGDRVVAEPLVVDPTRDLALLDLGESPRLGAVELDRASSGETVRLVGGAVSGDLDATVLRAAALVVDEVRGADRHRRGGYELDLSIERGDSGAGLYDADGHLVGLLFARSAERDAVAFAVDADEIRSVLDADPSTRWRCDPERSRLVAEGR